MTPPIAMLNPETAAPILDCSPDTVAELLNTGELPGLRYGRSWIIPPAALEQCLTSRAIEQMLARRAARNPEPEGAPTSDAAPTQPRALPRPKYQRRRVPPVLDDIKNLWGKQA